ncbi:MAG TPA: helix-hairpin-helix domain-containing protein [Phycisphaerales bacterium]|nr:helix-hairpin-helix domain-containing protein [Phycisphaerales bacterium]
MDGRFSITRGPALIALVSTLGVAGAGALAWSLWSRGTTPDAQHQTAPSTVVIAPTDVAGVAPQPVMVARPQPPQEHAATTVLDEAASSPPTLATEHPRPSEPLPIAPEPRVVDRTPHGPTIDEAAPPAVPTTPSEPAAEAPAPTTPQAQPAQQPSHQTDPTAPRAAPLVEPRKINVNTAPKAELELLPGVGPALADRIIEARAKKKFATLDDLDQVRGIGPKLLEKMKGRIVFQDPPKQSAPKPRGK